MSELVSSVNDLKLGKLGKAGGPNGIVAEMIKATLQEIAPILLPFYNIILSTSTFPTP